MAYIEITEKSLKKRALDLPDAEPLGDPGINTITLFFGDQQEDVQINIQPTGKRGLLDIISLFVGPPRGGFPFPLCVGDIVHYQVLPRGIRITGLLRTGEIPAIQRTFLNCVAGEFIAGTIVTPVPITPNTSVAWSDCILFEPPTFRLRTFNHCKAYEVMSPTPAEIKAFQTKLDALTASFNASMWPCPAPAALPSLLCSIMASPSKWRIFVEVHFKFKEIGDKIRTRKVKCATTASDFWHGWGVVLNRGDYRINYMLAPNSHRGIRELTERATTLGVGGRIIYF